MINIKNLDPNKIKIDEKSYKNTKELRQVKINSVNPLYLNINKINGYIEVSIRNKTFTLVPIDDRKEILKNMKN